MWFRKETEEKKSAYFSVVWIKAWKELIRESEKFKNAGKSWNTSLILRTDPTPSEIKKNYAIGIYLNLSYGECLEMRHAYKEDIPNTDIILTADPNIWIGMIEKSHDPTTAMVNGMIKVEKGSLVTLSTQRKAATELLRTAPYIHNGIPVERSLVSENYSDPTHKYFVTTSRGLDVESYPMQLFQEAKKVGIWNPSAIDLSNDAHQWTKLSREEKKLVSHLCGLLMAGEESLTLNLIPFIQAITHGGRMEEEIYLTSFLWEEAKHTEYFSHYVQTVMKNRPDFEQFHKPMFKILFYEKLPLTLHAMSVDSSPKTQLRAAGILLMIIKGTLAETGYASFSKILNENNLLPGMQDGISKIKQDESRHVAYGFHLMNRLLHENPQNNEWFTAFLEEHLYDSTNIIHEIFEQYSIAPFGLKKDWFLNHTVKLFQSRIAKLNL